jgi:hypothetical protein
LISPSAKNVTCIDYVRGDGLYCTFFFKAFADVLQFFHSAGPYEGDKRVWNVAKTPVEEYAGRVFAENCTNCVFVGFGF